MNIVYIACSCSPYCGSEDRIGWRVPLESANNDNRVIVITRSEQKHDIDRFCKDNHMENIKFFYVDIPRIYKRLCQGFFHSGRLNIWHRRAFRVVKNICKEEHIDLIHQITPVEFRSIGNYSKIKNVKFICGPLGGGEQVPKELKSYVESHKIVELIRFVANAWFRFKLLCNPSFCDEILFANKETKLYLQRCITENQKAMVTTEIAIDESDLIDVSQIKSKYSAKGVRKTRFLVAGRMIYRKGHELLLDALKNVPEEFDYECCILGEGPELKKLKEKCRGTILAERVSFLGKLPYSEMYKEYERADVFIMPSLRETTGSVLLEAMAKGLPVITINRFGSAVLLDNEAGWLYDGNSKTEFIQNLSKAITDCIMYPEKVIDKGQKARMYAEKYTWEKKEHYYQSLYEDVLTR